jgi:hypothetical protein
MVDHREDFDGFEGDTPPSGAWERFIFKTIIVLVILLAGAVWADTALFGRPGEMNLANRFVWLAVFGIGGVSAAVGQFLRRRWSTRSSITTESGPSENGSDSL